MNALVVFTSAKMDLSRAVQCRPAYCMDPATEMVRRQLGSSLRHRARAKS